MLARTPGPILEPESEEERQGTVPHVVFPTERLRPGTASGAQRCHPGRTRPAPPTREVGENT
ncbi:MAG: hypothetical protein ACRDYU_11845 [Actinomycetes bacterium]